MSKASYLHSEPDVFFDPIVVQSTTGGTHIRVPRDGESVYLRFTFCGLNTLGWAHLIDLVEGEDASGAVSCSRCLKAWDKWEGP